MSIVTLATNLSKAIDPSGNVYTYWPTAGGSRLAVPLTTAWSFPATCTGTDSVLAISSCSPPSFKGVYDFHGYYSPGVCYEGYEIGCVATVANVNYETVKPGETVAFCVPKNYQCGTKWSTPVSDFMSVSWAEPPETATHLPWGTAIQIRWQSSDSVALGSLYVPSSVVASILQGYAWSEATKLATSTSTSSSPARTGGTQSGLVTNGGLSSGHIAGIAVSVAAVVVGIMVAAFIIFRRKRRQLRAASQSPTDTAEDGPAELPYDPKASEKGAELPAARFEQDPEELPAGLAASSTPSGTEPAELADSTAQSTLELSGSTVQAQAATSTPSGTESAELAESTAQRTPELSGSLAPAQTELPGGPEAQTHTDSSTSPDSVVPARTELPSHQEAPAHTITQTSPGGVVELSTPSPVLQQHSSNQAETVEDLMARQAQLEERRQRLMQLQQIDEEQERIRQQLAELHGQQQPVQRAEMP